MIRGSEGKEGTIEENLFFRMIITQFLLFIIVVVFSSHLYPVTLGMVHK